ncbi:carboxylate-amine ligase [Dermatobacter hominis]|uniref:carboxylate-amine ligase n=1 Tax=Dermatobacter hominis TaxID=2884263 RepID=UPI001D125F03|nr:carboxylate-amine ligase [Dermatobacter hominis]UDY37537.1 carboxylate-amine ligase [Dermatobacter hominis]
MAAQHTPEALTMGVEEEFFIVDAASSELAPRSDSLVVAARDELGRAVTRELNRCQVETASAVCRTTDELHDDLVALRRGVQAAAAPLGLAVAAVATHPFSSWEDQEVAGDDRYQRLEDRYQVLARQQVICGCHVHVGVPDADVAIEVMNRSRGWLPALLALSANSPYWHGVDTGFDSYRTEVWTRWPTAGVPPSFEGREDYDARVEELRATGAIDDATHVYWHVRPSERWPTVEFRVCDVCLHVEDAVAVAALTRALVWTAREEARRGDAVSQRSHEALDAAVWRAARYGLGDELVDAEDERLRPAAEVVQQLVDHVADGLRAHGDLEHVQDRVGHILRQGNGAEEQRELVASAGEDPRAVVGELVARTTSASTCR